MELDSGMEVDRHKERRMRGKERKDNDKDVPNVYVVMEFAILLLPLAVGVVVADRWIMNTV